MVQAIDSIINKPVYNAVNINIKKPEINGRQSDSTTVNTDNGVYNAVRISIDNPIINTEAKKVYDYPENEEIVTYDMAQLQPVDIPQLPVITAYKSAVIIPEEETEEAAEVPAPNYTTVEAEKAEENTAGEEAVTPNGVNFHGSEPTTGVKRPEIVPSEDIKPDVDISLVVSKLTDKDYDVQATQMEEIARVSLEDPKKAMPYIVRDVFSTLIDITKKDTKDLPAPTEEQIEARRKIITNFLVMQNNPETKEVPFKLTEQDFALANEITPLEQAERNKEYALYTMAILAKVYVDEVEKETGNIVPLTDIPGVSATVDALRYNQNAGVKAAAIDALSHIQRDEYKEELTTLFTLAQSDNNPAVTESAQNALARLNKN